MRNPVFSLLFGLISVLAWRAAAADQEPAQPATLETSFVRFRLSPENGRYEILDKQANVTWRSNPYALRFGDATIRATGQQKRVNLDRCEVRREGDGLEAAFHPLSDQPAAWLRVMIRLLPDKKALEFSYQAADALGLENVRLLDDALWVTDAEKGSAAVPVREGLLVPADSGLAFTHRFDTFAYEGCHIEMLGLIKNGAAALVTWHDPYVAAELKSVLTNAPWAGGQQVLSPSLALRKTAKSFQIRFLGRGDHVTVALAYRQVAQEKGWLVKWADKLNGHPERAKLFGAINYKLWSTLDRRMNEESTKEQSVRVNWTFDEAAQIAEHLKNDLKLDKVLFIMGGWIRRGYDNQHPDILPAAPECGGNEAFADCARRVRRLGYLFCLHDNYQDMYRDAPSWDENFLMKNPDGSLSRGGHWAGGLAYLTCSQKAVELARRPQNLPAVKKLTDADAYFIDTTYAAGLQECFDKNHPLTRWDDLKWKQAISDYGREVFGIFGSECGREWAIPHSDFFEGLTGVSGRYYHDAGLVKKLGAVVVPLFEMVYRDTIAMYGKYGYDPAKAAEYVLHHISIGRPLHYHNIPPHLYWKKETARGTEPLALHPAVAEVKQTAPRQFTVAYRWAVEKAPGADWRIFVHFTDADGNIKFQNDHEPAPPASRWPAGDVGQGPFSVTVPEGLAGTFDVRMGLFQPATGQRATLDGAREGERSQLVGKLKINAEKIEFEPAAKGIAPKVGDVAVFTRADGGWAEGLHLVDRFVKNTYEILSPLNEITSQVPMTRHQFLTPDRKVQRTVFGEGQEAVEVLVNAGAEAYRHPSKAGGEVVLPPYGFLIESPVFVAFHALSWNGLRYEAPALFALRSLDGQPLGRSSRVRIYHGFGEARVKLGKAIHRVEKEGLVAVSDQNPNRL